MVGDIATVVAAGAFAALGVALVFFTPAAVRLFAKTQIWLSRRLGSAFSTGWYVWFPEMMTGMKWPQLMDAASKTPKSVPYYIWLFRVLGIVSWVVALVLLGEAM